MSLKQVYSDNQHQSKSLCQYMIHPLAAHSTFVAFITLYVHTPACACACVHTCRCVCERGMCVRPHTFTRAVQTSRGVKLNPSVQWHADDVLQWPSCSLHQCN